MTIIWKLKKTKDRKILTEAKERLFLKKWQIDHWSVVSLSKDSGLQSAEFEIRMFLEK